jgi:uncharacterized protein (DUF2147 family)
MLQQIKENFESVWETKLLLRLWLIAIWLGGSIGLAQAATTPPTGRWITADHSTIVQIAPCGADLCGQIIGIVLANPTGPMPDDWQGQPLCGRTIIKTSPMINSLTGSISWVGTVLDPRYGNVYQATIGLDQNHDLRLHGYLGLPIIGQTQTWMPFNGRTPLGCRLAAAQLLSQG